MQALSSGKQMAGVALPERLLQRWGPHYILAMFIATRISGSVGGALVVYYVDLILHLPEKVLHHFHVLALVFVLLALTLTTIVGMWETRDLRKVLRLLHSGRRVRRKLGQRAGTSAVNFPARHHYSEAWLVPLTTVVPVLIVLKVIDDIDGSVMRNISLAVFMGLAMALMSTYLMIEKLMQPVIRHLLDHGVMIDYENLPVSKLRTRLIVNFSLIIFITALMIGTLAGERASDIVNQPEQQREAVASLRLHSTYITIAAVVVGLVFCTAVSQSVTSRVENLVKAMKHVESGSLTERLQPTGNDDIDVLTRQFNAMVTQLQQNDSTIRMLNTTLEMKVAQRTQQLSQSKKDLQRSFQQLQEYNRLKTEFFANVSHELRTPLTMIVAPVERLLESQGPQLPEPVVSMLNVVRINSNRLLELINRLLDLSKLEAGQATLNMAAVNLNQLVEQMVAAAAPLAAHRGVDLELQCDASVPVLGADGEKVEIVISNLLSNALKFTPAGGRVEIQTAREQERICLSVRDSGIGIAESDLSRIFERFVQLDGSTSRRYSGTGLGLPLIKDFVELHGGEVRVESELGLGSQFFCYLPIVEPPESQTNCPMYVGSSKRAARFSDLMECNMQDRQEVSGSSAAPAYARKILVVDDTPEIRALVGDILGDHYHVIFACDGEEGTAAALSELPDLIVSDIMMPRVDGYEFCRRMKENPQTADIPFVMLTAKAQQSMKVEGLERGAIDYVLKPFDPEELRARVANLLKLHSLHRQLDQRNKELENTLNQLRETQSQLIQSEKMSSLGQLVAGLAHEINNAINAVYNGIRPLRLKTTRLQEQVAQSIEGHGAALTRDDIDSAFHKISVLAGVIEEGATRTARIVSDLKTFSHPGSEAPSRFDLHEALDMCLNLLFGQIKNRIVVDKHYQGEGTICGPRGQLNQVFMNILNNAQQAIPDRGRIVVSTRRERDRVLVSIRDTGGGMCEETKSRIFDPFFTTKEPGVGTGLGLSVSYGLVSQLGGSIECQSELGKGTEFLISLPSSFAPPPATGTMPGDLCLASAAPAVLGEAT